MIARLFVAIGFFVAMPVLAQSETGTRLGGRPAQVPNEGRMPDVQRARIWLERYAACLAKRDPMRVAKVLDAPINVVGNMRDLSMGNFDSCLSAGGDADQLRMSYALLRGALYADRVSHLYRELKPEMVATRPLVIGEAIGDSSRLAIVQFGDCVMRQNPDGALAYVSSHATTGIEDKALAAIKPALAACIYSDQKVKLSRDSIKAALAEAIYRTMRAPVVTKVSVN